MEEVIKQGLSRDAIFLIVSVVVLIGILIFARHRQKASNLKVLEETPEERKKRKRDFSIIKKLFDLQTKNKLPEGTLDDQTWEDLEMDKVYKEMDYTLTTPGMQKLYCLLRKPELDAGEIKRRRAVISFLQKDVASNNKIRRILALLGRQMKGDIATFIYENKHKYVNKLIFDLLSLLPFLLVFTFPFVGGYAVMLAIGALALNMAVHYNINNKINAGMYSINYLASIAAAVDSIVKVDIPQIKEYSDILRKCRSTCEIILKNSKAVERIEGVDVFGDYFNIIFLFQVRAYYKIMNKLENSKEDLVLIYNIIGEIDSIAAVACYKNDIKDKICEAEFIEDRSLMIKAALNPLLIEGIANDITIGEKGIILTGSNMSGKSTYLRTAGVNSTLAQTFGFALALEYKGVLLKIVSSISPRDDISKGKSYYLGEAEAVHRVIKESEGEIPVLCIIDEIFRGTNPMERIAASTEILLYLMKKRALVLVATHDLELTDYTKGYLTPYYFSEDVDDTEGLTFDYRLREGVSPTRNAIKFLRYLGYPEEIVKKAEKRIS
ncbi:MutS-related protein [Alloiococcus sp. CFN-8]|uniref:MutS-related protein n=1 Tax=Alloiococcus sp. CFN-8 TaxID=3416081 RepID=UPI003CF47CAB